jgi:hypothetical protein
MEQKYMDLITYLSFVIPIMISSIYIFRSKKPNFIIMISLNIFFYITLILTL